MKTKAVIVLIVFANFRIAFGQHFQNNGDLGAGPWQNQQQSRPPVYFHDSQGVLTNIEWRGGFLGYCIHGYGEDFYEKDLSTALITARRVANEEIDRKNKQIINSKIGAFDYDIRTKSNALYVALGWARDKTNAMEAVANHTYKKTLPEVENPWRKVGGKTVFIPGDGRFHAFGGKIIQTTSDGILIADSIGDTGFVKHYPYRYPDESMISGWAMNSDPYSYNNVLAASKTVLGFEYGIPCDPPSDADSIKAKALELTPDETNAIIRAGNDALEQVAKAEADIEAAKQEEQDYINQFQKILSDQKAATQGAHAQKLKEAQDRVFKNEQSLADKGDPYGLLRMGERYRDGAGVEKDLAKARSYLKKATDAGSPTAADELKKLSPQ